jgi:hypothetical protein
MEMVEVTVAMMKAATLPVVSLEVAGRRTE